MSCVELVSADLRLKVDPVSLGLEDTSSLVGSRLPGIGQARAEVDDDQLDCYAAARSLLVWR